MSNALHRPPHLLPLLRQLKQTALPCFVAETEHRLALGDAIELNRLQSLAEREPGLALSILLAANARTSAEDELRGLQQGIHRLGSGGVQRLLRGLPRQRYDRAQPGHRLSLQAMATSRLAWLFLAHWLRTALASDEDARLSMLTLLDVARWKLPLAAPALAVEIERRVQAGERRSRVERELLGADLDALNVWHLQDLGLPCAESLQRCRWSPMLLARAARQVRGATQVPSLPAPLKIALRERGLLCGLAQVLALEAGVDWYSPRTRSLIQAAAAVSGKSAEEILRGVHRQALFASHEAMFGADAPAPAAGLLRPPRAPRALARTSAGQPAAKSDASAVATAAPAAAAPSPAGDDALAGFARRCEAGHPDLRSLLADVVRLFARLGLKRCALFLRETDRSALACFFSFGFTQGQAGRDLRLPVGEPGLVRLLLAQPGVAFRIAQAQRAGVVGKLPPGLADWPPSGGMLLATIAVQGRAVGFWWADAGPEAPEASVESFARFRRVVESFGPAFTRQLEQRSPSAASANASGRRPHIEE
ncbi:hypothetical protein [Aquimonas voraii]|uniref:HDOD domain-containing protein n=1 Tax=Aquimonas voraii TaxID=265719 RepID=A0A1G6UFF3_9GAMM|nr:hypothetical protein [Aquimonas voraii]SDD40140.1 hypothetical protein SAMN04488509_102317 [Aquimonas voraii]